MLQRFDRAFDSGRITIGRFSRNECKQSRSCNGLLDTCLPHESYDQRDTVRQAVRLAAPVIRNTGRVEGGFIRELCSWGRSWVMNLWDLI